MPPTGDSSVTQTWFMLGSTRKVQLDVTFDSGDGSFTSTALSQRIDGFLLRMTTNPGSPAPTANYDITLIDGESVDALQGLGADRHTSTTQDVQIVYSGTANCPPVSYGDTLTLAISGNSQAGAQTRIVLYFSAAR